jgi:hypothetical protein
VLKLDDKARDTIDRTESRPVTNRRTLLPMLRARVRITRLLMSRVRVIRRTRWCWRRWRGRRGGGVVP